MNENQNIEWKSSWRDEFLKTVCAFANTGGGHLFIGKNDEGETVGIQNFNKLLEDIPSKIRNYLGIICTVNLIEENTLYIIEIITLAQSVAISFKGKYYYRTGSTTVELGGNDLTDFLLRKSGKTWDTVIEPSATIQDIDEDTLQRFLKDAGNTGRLPDVAGLSNFDILEKLRLTEGTNLKRAAIILFGKAPNRLYINIKVKIGRFKKDDTDLIFQEIEEGNLVQLLYAIPDTLSKKFLIRKISYDGLQRIEKGEYPFEALRELLLNALVHRNYLGAITQIRVYDDQITFWNDGGLPAGLTIADLKQTHPSKPRNPLIAEVCAFAGYIEAWGRGTLKVIEACKKAALPEPQIAEHSGGVLFSLYKPKIKAKKQKANLAKQNLNERQLKAIKYLELNEKITNKIYQDINNCARNTATKDLAKLVELHIIKSNQSKGAGVYYSLH